MDDWSGGARICVVALLTALAGCSPREGGEPQVTDWTAVRTVEFGDTVGDGQLSAVFGVAEGSDGTVFVSEPEFARVVAFQPDGTFGRVVGGRGEGPGEFRVPGALSWRGDSLAVTDFMQGISLFAPDGRFATRIAFNIESRGGPFGGRPLFALPDGSVAVTVPADQRDVVAGAVTREPWLDAARDGTLLDTLVWIPLEGLYYGMDAQGATRVGVHPFPWNPLLTIAPDGSSLVVVERAPAERGDPSQFRVLRVDLSGDTVDVGTVPYVPHAIPTEKVDSAAEEIAARWARRLQEKPASFLGAARGDIPWPAFYPPVTAVLAGSDGSVWLRREDLSGDQVEWDVLDAELRPVGRVALPAGLELKVVALDRVYGVALDALDVPTVVRYRIDAGG